MVTLSNNFVDDEIKLVILVDIMNTYSIYCKFKSKAWLRINRVIYFDSYLRKHLDWSKY